MLIPLRNYSNYSICESNIKIDDLVNFAEKEKLPAMALTDYNVGTNHILPTLGSAKFSSGLSIDEFYKKTSYIKLTKKGIEVIAKKAITLAEYEGLIGHAQSIKSRIRRS